MVFRATPFEVKPGDYITIDGSGFSKTLNKVYFDGGSVLNASSANGTSLIVPVPALTEGQYKVSVSNVLGSSENPDISVFIKVTSTPESGPTISSASISGETVLLAGTGFTTSNTVATTLGNSTPISASGNTLTFRLNELSQYEQVKKSMLGRPYKLVLWIFVQNEHGINKDPYKLDIII